MIGISSSKKRNLPKYTLIKILTFLEQEVEIRNLCIHFEFSFSHYVVNVFYVSSLYGMGGKALISFSCFRNRIPIKVQIGKFSLTEEILSLK